MHLLNLQLACGVATHVPPRDLLRWGTATGCTTTLLLHALLL